MRSGRIVMGVDSASQSSQCLQAAMIPLSLAAVADTPYVRADGEGTSICTISVVAPPTYHHIGRICRRPDLRSDPWTSRVRLSSDTAMNRSKFTCRGIRVRTRTQELDIERLEAVYIGNTKRLPSLLATRLACSLALVYEKHLMPGLGVTMAVWFNDSAGPLVGHRNNLTSSYGHTDVLVHIAVSSEHRTRCSIRSTARPGGSCSQIRTTSQPEALRAAETCASRSTVRSNLGRQYSRFTRGFRPWSGHRCHQQPSTKTATLWRMNTTSGRTLKPSATTGRSTRNRNPR
jgi:hypothetical protein